VSGLDVVPVTLHSVSPTLTVGAAPKLEPETVKVCAPDPVEGVTDVTVGVEAAE